MILFSSSYLEWVIPIDDNKGSGGGLYSILDVNK